MTLRNILEKVKSYLNRPTVGELLQNQIDYDDNEIRIRGISECSSIKWDNIQRIAYRTTDSGPFWDYFLEIQLKDTKQWITLEFGMQGSGELADEIDRKFDTQYGPEGKLANSIDNKSVIIWPAEDAGKRIEEVD